MRFILYTLNIGIPPNHISAPGPPLYAPQVVIQPNASVDLVSRIVLITIECNANCYIILLNSSCLHLFILKHATIL